MPPFIDQTRPNDAAVTSVDSSASAVTLLARNVFRRGVVIHNDSTAILYVKFGASPSATSFTYKLASQATLELPFPVYRGVITGIWASANGAARITEVY